MKNKYIKYIASILMLVLIAIFFRNNYQKLLALSKIEPENGVLLLLVALFAFLPNALEFKIESQIFKLNLSFKEWFGLTAINSLYNYILPFRGGILARAYYLKRKYDFEYSQYISLTAGALLISFIVASFSAILLLVIQYCFYDTVNQKLFILSSVLFLVSIAAVAFAKIAHKLSIKTKWKNINFFLLNTTKGLNSFIVSSRSIVWIVLSQLLIILFMGLRLYLSFKVIDLNVSLINMFIVQSLVVFSMVISLTPGNLGVKEGIIGLLSTSIGVPINDALMAAAIDRASSMIVIFILGSIFHFSLMKNDFNLSDDKH